MTLSELCHQLIERNKFGYEHPFRVSHEDWQAIRVELQEAMRARDNTPCPWVDERCQELHFLVMGTPIALKAAANDAEILPIAAAPADR